MSRFFTRTSLFAAAMFVGFSGFSAGQASACDVPRCYWKTVTVYVEEQVPYVRYVTKYDHCGKPYAAKVVDYRTVKVPVQTRVKVCY
jgi:hypothetical protein